MQLHQSTKPKHKNLATKLCLLVAILTHPSLQQETRRINEFFITKLEKPSVDTSKPLSSQSGSIRVKTQTKYTGKILTSWSSDLLTAEVQYREPEVDPIKSIRILTFTFPFKLNDLYSRKKVAYSSQRGEAAEGFVLSEDDIAHHLIDQELNFLKGEVIDSGYLLKNIFAEIELDKRTDSDGDVYLPHVYTFEAYFEDDQSVFHLIIDRSMYTTDLDSNNSSGAKIFAMVLVGGFVGSLVVWSQFMEFFNINFSEALMTFSASEIYILNLGLSGFILLKYVKNRSNYQTLLCITIILFLVFRGCGSIIQLLHLLKIHKSPKIKCYILTLVVAHLAWLAALTQNNRFFLRGFIFYSVLVIIDLVFLRESVLLRSKPAWKAWAVVMLQQVFTQSSVYSIYFFAFWRVHTSAPPIMTEFIVPDIVTLIFMLVVFHSRFKLPNKFRKKIVQKKLTKPGYSRIDGRVEPIISFFGHIDQVLIEYSPENYESKKFRNVPVERKDRGIVPQNPVDTIVQIFNLNSKRSHLSGDYTAVGSLMSSPGIRYVVNGRKGWDLILKNNNEALNSPIFIEKVFIGNQERKDMVAYVHKTDMRARLVSLSSRKVILNAKFGYTSRIGPVFRPSSMIFSLFGEKKTPCILAHSKEFLSVDTASYHKTTADRKIKYFFEVSEKSDRVLLPHQEYAFFGNLIAVKYIWIDKDNYGRIYSNKAKYQTVLIYRVDESNFSINCVKSLRKITEGMFSAFKIDSFFFLDGETLAMVMDAKVYLIDWKGLKVKQCVEIAGLYTPLLSQGVKREECFASYWYDRKSGVVKFSVGTFDGGLKHGKEDINRYLTNQNRVNVKYYYSGWFSDLALSEPEVTQSPSQGATQRPNRYQVNLKPQSIFPPLEKNLNLPELKREA